jgi:predicted DNA-binding transcriptional regulator AlpA
MLWRTPIHTSVELPSHCRVSLESVSRQSIHDPMKKRNIIQAQALGESPSTKKYLTRKELALRWSISRETLKRRERQGLLHPVRFGGRTIRYTVSEIIKIEVTGDM